MSNNIYDIINKLNQLEHKNENLTESKKVCKTCDSAKCKCEDTKSESKKKDKIKESAIFEAVKKVEESLTEKYMGFKKLEKSIAAKGDVRDPAAVAASIGRKKYGKEKFQKAAAAGKKLGEMGPSPLGQINSAGSKATASDAATTAPRERERVVSPKIDKYEKDQAAADKTRRWIVDKESPKANDFGRRVGKTIAEPIAAIKSAWHGATDAWDQTMGNDTAPDPKPPVSVMTRDQARRAGINEVDVEESGLQAYLGKKKYGKEGMAALQKAGREGASKEKMAMIRARHDKMDEGNQLPSPPDEVHLPKKGSKHGPVDVYKKPKNEDMLSPAQKKFAALAEPKDKITYADKIAGAKKKQKDEGNEFSGELVKARAQGKDSFDVDGKTYPVKEGFPTVADAEKRMREKEGKTSHGKKTTTATGTKHERDYDAVDKGADVDMTPKGRGRPKKDKFAR